MSPGVLSNETRQTLSSWRQAGQRIVFTNGVFDLIHAGHVQYLEEAQSLGERLVIGVNSDDSVRLLKGEGRPLMVAEDRVRVLNALRCVDLTVVFEDETPQRLIEEIAPDVLVKGGDWPVARIVGRAVVEAAGGRVLSLPLREGRSTSGLIERIRAGKSALDE